MNKVYLSTVVFLWIPCFYSTADVLHTDYTDYWNKIEDTPTSVGIYCCTYKVKEDN